MTDDDDDDDEDDQQANPKNTTTNNVSLFYGYITLQDRRYIQNYRYHRTCSNSRLS